MTQLPAAPANLILFVDTETGGLSPELHDLLTVAAVLVDADTQQLLLSRSWNISRFQYRTTARAMEVNQLSLKSLRETGVPASQVRAELLDLAAQARELAGCKVPLGGHNVNFDLRFLDTLHDSEAERDEWRSAFDHNVVDTKPLAGTLRTRGYLGKKQSLSLTHLVDAMNLEKTEGEAHQALYDAVMTAKLYFALCAALPSASEVRALRNVAGAVCTLVDKQPTLLEATELNRTLSALEAVYI